MASPVIEEIAQLDCQGVHNFSLGTLDAYFGLNDCLKSGKGGLVAPGLLSLTGRTGKVKSYLFDNTSLLLALTEYRKRGPVYAINRPQDGMPKPGAFVEIVYDLPEVLNPQSYDNAKKRAQRLKYPFKWLADRDIRHEALSAESFVQVKDLHDLWVGHKLNDPNTFKMMFPTKRYIACVERCLPKKTAGLGLQKTQPQVPISYHGYTYWVSDRLVACRVISTQHTYARRVAFDLAFFGDTWSTESQIMTYLNIYSLKHIHEELGVEWFNCGDSLNKSLKAAKSHYPFFTMTSYAYPQEKQ